MIEKALFCTPWQVHGGRYTQSSSEHCTASIAMVRANGRFFVLWVLYLLHAKTMATTLARAVAAPAKACSHVTARALSSNVPATTGSKQLEDIYAAAVPQQSGSFVQRMKNGTCRLAHGSSRGIRHSRCRTPHATFPCPNLHSECSDNAFVLSLYHGGHAARPCTDDRGHVQAQIHN